MIDGAPDLPASMRALIERLLENMKALDRQVKELEAQIKARHQGSELSRKLEKIPGIGPLAAKALVASIGDARSFKNGRQVAACLWLVPKQDSSDGKPKLLGTSKRGDTYLRALLTHGSTNGLLRQNMPKGPQRQRGFVDRDYLKPADRAFTLCTSPAVFESTLPTCDKQRSNSVMRPRADAEWR